MDRNVFESRQGQGSARRGRRPRFWYLPGFALVVISPVVALVADGDFPVKGTTPLLAAVEVFVAGLLMLVLGLLGWLHIESPAMREDDQDEQ